MSNFRELVPEMAIEYPFELDDFQKEAIAHLEQNENVFVAARKIETQTHSNPIKASASYPVRQRKPHIQQPQKLAWR
jgi:hypothetical protein